MKNLHIFALILSFVVPGLVQADAVEKTNYSVSASIDRADYGDYASLSGSVRTPLTRYTGMSVYASLWKSNADKQYPDSSSRFIGTGVFVRDPSIGAIYANYGHQRIKYDYGFTEISLNIDTYGLSGSYYLERSSVYVSRSWREREERESSNYSSLGGSYYPNDNWAAYFSIGGMDDKDEYTLSVEYQPKIFKQSISLSAGYHDFDWDQSINLSLSYFFDTRVSLMKRDRNY